MEKVDVLIVGAGPAGSACARHLVQNGRKVILLDKCTFPRRKLCAGWITPQVFRYLGITPQDYPHSLTHFRSFHISIKGMPFILPTDQYAIRRIEFDNWLLNESHAEFRHHHVTKIEEQNGIYVVDDSFSAPFLVGAAGTNCPVFRKFFQPLTPRHDEALIVAMEEEFPYLASDDRCHLWFFENGISGYAWYVPKIDGFVNVGIGAFQNSLAAKQSTIKTQWIRLIEKLEKQGLVVGHDYHRTGHSYYLRREDHVSRVGNVLLAGDSLGLATRDMGEGIGAAIRSGQLAAEAILGDFYPNYNEIPLNSIPSILGLRH